MQNSPVPEHATTNTRNVPRNLIHTVGLACALLLIPALIGVILVQISHTFSPHAQPPPADMTVALTNRLYDGSALNVQQLGIMRRDLRNAGYVTDDVNLRLWAAHASEPEILFSVKAPEQGKKWNWYISQDGLHAIAVSIQRDAFERRAVGLYDLLGSKWVWTNALPWPDSHEHPYVFGKTLVLRFSKNAKRFALEINDKGQIVHIDTLGKGYVETAHAIVSNPRFPGTPIAIKNGVFFASDTQTDTLNGYAYAPLPGFRYAGKGNANTIFSGDGRLKFTAENGHVTVADSLTQTVLQTFDAWVDNTNTAVTATLTPHDGSRLTVFLKTDFGGTPPIVREWSIAIDLYSGSVTKSFNADTLFAKPKPKERLLTTSPDGLWQLSVNASNDLTISSVSHNRTVACVSLAALGCEKPIDQISFLEEGRHVVFRQNDNFWLLDFVVACGYGDLVARQASSSCTNLPITTATAATPSDMLATNPNGQGISAPFDSDTLSYANDTGLTVPAYLALKAELFAANQAWGYAAELLEQTRRLQEYDVRAPQVNPLLLARYFFLSAQPSKARQTCREALGKPFMSATNENKIVRYQLQGLFFAKP